MTLATIAEITGTIWMELTLSITVLVYVGTVVWLAKWIGRHEDLIADMSDSDEDI